MKNNKFEDKIIELEQIVKELETDKISLEDGIEKFQQGVEIYKELKDVLEKSQKKVNELTRDLQEISLE